MARDDQPRARLARRLDGHGGAAGGRQAVCREGAALTDELRSLEERWASAVERRDVQTAEQILAEDFTLSSTGGVGGEIGRDAWLAVLREIETRSAVCEVLEIRTFGDVAVVHARLEWDARLGARDLTGDYSVVDIFTRDDTTWRASWRVSVRS